MNDFLKDYEFLYSYKKSHRKVEIAREGLKPRQQPGYAPEAPGKSPIICMANEADMPEYLRQQRAGNQDVFVCRIRTALLKDLRLGLDWSSTKTEDALREGKVERFEFLTTVDQEPSLVHAIEVIGSLACYDPIPTEAIEAMSIDDFIEPEPPPEWPHISMDDFKPLPPFP